MSNSNSKKLKTTYQVDSPFTNIQWPEISSQNQDTILELLCSLLSPIGKWRTNHVTTSKGKRDKKRKRQEVKSRSLSSIDPIPPPPEVSPFVIVGLSDISRKLQACSQTSLSILPQEDSSNDSSPPKLGASQHNTNLTSTEELPQACQANVPTTGHLRAIFVLKPSQPIILHDHLPQLVANASSAFPRSPATKLVQLPMECNARLCEALKITRVSSIGLLENAPHSKSLMDFIRDSVPEIEIPWLLEAKNANYLPVKINAIETLAPGRRGKGNKGS